MLSCVTSNWGDYSPHPMGEEVKSAALVLSNSGAPPCISCPPFSSHCCVSLCKNQPGAHICGSGKCDIPHGMILGQKGIESGKECSLSLLHSTQLLRSLGGVQPLLPTMGTSWRRALPHCPMLVLFPSLSHSPLSSILLPGIVAHTNTAHKPSSQVLFSESPKQVRNKGEGGISLVTYKQL